MNCPARLSLLRSLLTICLLLLAGATARAQITDVNDTTSTPIEGAGHDYIKALSETVSPANGSVTLRINVPVAKGRGLTIPFSFGYDSNGFRHLKPGMSPNYGTVSWVSNTGYTGQGGWVYSIPQLNVDTWQGVAQVLTGIQDNQPVYQNYYCDYATAYTFRDGSGGVHALGLGARVMEQNPTPEYCMYATITGGGDPQVSAVLTTRAYGLTTGDEYLSAPVNVYTADGTLYYFATSPPVYASDNTSYVLPTYIEDRNGNRITVSGSTFTDTLGRTLFSGSLGAAGQTKTVTISGINYQVTWKSVSASYSVTQQWAGPANGPAGGANCWPIPAVNDTQTVVSTITLPNGQAYTFYYGTDSTPHNAITNTYGLLSEVDYPDGGWVQYTWKPSDTTNELADYPGIYTGTCPGSAGVYCPTPAQDACLYQYTTPVVASRIVSFGGSTIAQTQTFSYSTTWNPPVSGNTLGTTWSSKSTNVTTTDNVLGKSTLTKYNYGYVVAPPVPFTSATLPNQIPVESTISYYDWNNTSMPIRTVTKIWYDQYDLASEATTEAGKTSQTVYCYVGTNCVPANFILSRLQEKDDYDFGATTPTRRTVTTYQGFSGALGAISDAPCKTVVTDNGGNRYAETDYYYDGDPTLCDANESQASPVRDAVTVISGTHDDTTFGQVSTVPRGNLTTKVQWANTGTSPTTTYTYDETGQVTSKKDACGNATCSDVSGSNHTTSFSYADAYTILSGGSNTSYTPSGTTNAYLTQVTDPLGHQANFTYDFYSGQLTQSKDANSQSTTYLYNDVFSRPTLLKFPDGGQKTISYNDSPYNPSAPSPSVTVSTLMAGFGNNLVNTTAFDGMGHTAQTILSSDPTGADYVTTSYFGSGKPFQTTNPYRTTASSTDGNTKYTYDGLGRTTGVSKSDGSVVMTTYDQTITNLNAICSTVTDEVGNSRQSCSDGLGRLIQVNEPGTGATGGGVGSGTVTIGGSEQQIVGNSGKGTVTISGSGKCTQQSSFWVPDSGSVSVTVHGAQTATSTATWGGSCDSSGNFSGASASNVASTLATYLSSSAAGVYATASNATVQITAIATGTGSNYGLGYACTNSPSSTCDFTVSGPSSLTGGTITSVSDSGTASLSVSGFPASYSYGAGDTTASIASGLAAELNESDSPVSAQVSGSTITVTANQGGSVSNYSLSGSTTWNTQSFHSPSFNISLSGSTLTGGADGNLGTSPLVTQYSYDILNNLLSVQQQGATTNTLLWRPRTFQYDSLSRLTSAGNPESGTIGYTYDANGNVSIKTGPRPNQTVATTTVTTNYFYDGINRLIKKNYLDGTSADPYTQTVQYGYDAGALSGCTIAPPSATDSYPAVRATSMCDGSGATSWTHDKMGRVLQESRNIGGSSVNHQVNYTYNVDGSLATLVTPPMKSLVYSYNTAGQAISLTDRTDQINFATSATYAPPGELTGMTLGSSSTFTGFTVNNAYNTRLQPILLSATNAQTSATVFSECFDFHLRAAIASPSPCSFSASTAGDNGNVYSIVNNRDATRTQLFTYDNLNRIASAQSSGSQWGETFTVDAWGNLTNKAGISGKTYAELWNAPAQANNQLTGYGYDAAGNMTSNGSTTYVYDAENRLVWTGGYRYVYDGQGERVEKCQAASATTACPTSGTAGKLYWKGTGSDPLAETDLAGNQQEEYLFFRGQRIARRDVSSSGATIAVHYYFSDHLGTHGVVESATGTTCEQDTDYYPYGAVEKDYCGSSGVAQNYKFTGKERDAESNLDMFGARYYGSSLGRFMTADWAAKPTAVPYAHFGNPQSLNLYSYVQNNPLSRVDLDGHGWWDKFKNLLNYGQYAEGAALQKALQKDADQLRLKFVGQHVAVDGKLLTVPQLNKMSNTEVIDMWGEYEFSNATGNTDVQASVGGVVYTSSQLGKTEIHHGLPRQFSRFFSDRGLDIEDYTMEVSAGAHRLGPDAVHRGQGEENWNGAWRQWIANNPNATREQILEQLNNMKVEFGVGGRGGESEEEPPVIPE